MNKTCGMTLRHLGIPLVVNLPDADVFSSEFCCRKMMGLEDDSGFLLGLGQIFYTVDSIIFGWNFGSSVSLWEFLAIKFKGVYLKSPPTWRIIPVVVSSYCSNYGDRKSPRPGVVGPLPNGLFMAYKWGLLTTY